MTNLERMAPWAPDEYYTHDLPKVKPNYFVAYSTPYDPLHAESFPEDFRHTNAGLVSFAKYKWEQADQYIAFCQRVMPALEDPALVLTLIAKTMEGEQ